MNVRSYVLWLLLSWLRVGHGRSSPLLPTTYLHKVAQHLTQKFIMIVSFSVHLCKSGFYYLPFTWGNVIISSTSHNQPDMGA